MSKKVRDTSEDREAQDRILKSADASMEITMTHMKHGDPNKGRKHMMTMNPMEPYFGSDISSFIPMTDSIEVLPDERLPTTRNVFFRKPRSKRKRIINKWRARGRNWRDEPWTIIIAADQNAMTYEWVSKPLSVDAENIEIKLPINNSKKPIIICNTLGLEAIHRHFPVKETKRRP